jgi:hypothetical protein
MNHSNDNVNDNEFVIVVTRTIKTRIKESHLRQCWDGDREELENKIELLKKDCNPEDFLEDRELESIGLTCEDIAPELPSYEESISFEVISQSK